MLRRCGIEPSRWHGVVEHFGDWFHRAVGHVNKLTEVVLRGGRRWIQGIRACRDAFT
jgi:hypothetical protein